MAKKTEIERLTDAVKALTAAVLDNTTTLKKAMGSEARSTDKTDDLVKVLTEIEREKVPEDATPEEIVERVAGRLVPGIDVQAFVEKGRTEVSSLRNLGQDRPFQGLFGLREDQHREEQ